MSGRAIEIDGKVVPEPDLLAWALWFESADRTVAKTAVGPLTVSTVFLGLDHGFGGPPEWYETMTFGDDEERTRRHADRPQAELGHAALVRELRAEFGLDK